MAHAHHETTIERPTEVVFDFLADGTNNHRWVPRVVSTTNEGSVVEAGTTFRQRARHPLGFSIPTDYTLITYDRPAALAYRTVAGGPIRPTVTFELSAVGPTTTTVRVTVEYRPLGAMRLATPLMPIINVLFRRESTWLDAAKAVLESPFPASRTA